MKLNQSPEPVVRVYELAKELGWPAKQLVAELRCRGEYVKSSMSTLPAPVVRAIRREFATNSNAITADTGLNPDGYGKSASTKADERAEDSFAAALAKARSYSVSTGTGPQSARWRPRILQALLDDVVVPRRPDHLDEPNGGYFRWEIRRAEALNVGWAEARLTGLDGDDQTVIKWIRLSDGERPEIAAELSRGGISPEEAELHIGYGGRIDVRWPSIYARYRDGRIVLSEAILAVRLWRENHQTG